MGALPSPLALALAVAALHPPLLSEPAVVQAHRVRRSALLPAIPSPSVPAHLLQLHPPQPLATQPSPLVLALRRRAGPRLQVARCSTWAVVAMPTARTRQRGRSSLCDEDARRRRFRAKPTWRLRDLPTRMFLDSTSIPRRCFRHGTVMTRSETSLITTCDVSEALSSCCALTTSLSV